MARFAGGVTQITATVTSTSVPVNIISPANKRNSWIIKARQANAQTVWIFAYTGDLPSAAPTDVYELAAGQDVDDTVLAPGADVALDVGWAMVLGSAGTATVDAMWR